jgi:hypothetical protein
VEKWWRRVNTVQILCTHVCRWENDICWNYSWNGGWMRWRRMVEGVSSSMTYLIHFKNVFLFIWGSNLTLNDTMYHHPAQQ